MNWWNELLFIKNDITKLERTRLEAEILLKQCNTAGGYDMIQKEVDNFINKNKKEI